MPQQQCVYVHPNDSLYLAELEKRGKIRQVGTTGRGVKYVKL